MHTLLSLLTMPVSGSFFIAPVGQFSTQAGLSQWLHVMDV